MTDDVMEGEVVHESRTLAVREETPQQMIAPRGLFATDNPREVIKQAVDVADALMDVVRKKGWAKRIQGREFLELPAWQTIGAMLSVTPFCEWSRPIENGWEARVVVRKSDGVEIAAAEAQCTRSERTWSNRDDYAIRSMAQTRATSKALRSALGFIAAIAGFADTPAAEMPEEEAPRSNEPPESPAVFGAKLCRKIGISDKERHAYIKAQYGVDSFTEMDPAQIREVCKFFQDVKRKEREQHASGE